MLATPENSVAGEWSSTLLSSYSNLMLYSAYDISVRTDRSSGSQPTRPEESTIGQLAAAPFSSAIGEEAFYRGLVYERTLRAHGRPAARLLDAALFPLVHLPTDMQRGFKPPTVAFNVAWRSAMTPAFDATYDRGGLPLSVALHYWSNVLLAMSHWWFYGGHM